MLDILRRALDGSRPQNEMPLRLAILTQLNTEYSSTAALEFQKVTPETFGHTLSHCPSRHDVWLSLQKLVRYVCQFQSIELVVCDCTKSQLSDRVREKPLNWEFNPSADLHYEPYCAILVDFDFSHMTEDIELLAALGAYGQSRSTPILTNASVELFGIDCWSDLLIPRDLGKIFDASGYEPWQAFRRSEAAEWIILLCPEPRVAAQGIRPGWALLAVLARAFDRRGFTASIEGLEYGSVPFHEFKSVPDTSQDVIAWNDYGLPKRRIRELKRLGISTLVYYPQLERVYFPALQDLGLYDYWEQQAGCWHQLSTKMVAGRFIHALCLFRDQLSCGNEFGNVAKQWLSCYLAFDNESCQWEATLPSPYRPLKSLELCFDLDQNYNWWPMVRLSMIMSTGRHSPDRDFTLLPNGTYQWREYAVPLDRRYWRDTPSWQVMQSQNEPLGSYSLSLPTEKWNRSLPLVVGIIADLSGLLPKMYRERRRFVDIDSSNFEEVKHQIAGGQDSLAERPQSNWNFVRWLVQLSERSHFPVIVRVLDCKKHEFAKDLERAVEFDQSVFFKEVCGTNFDTAGACPFTLILSDACFASSGDDTNTLRDIAGVAACSHAIFCGSIGPEFFGADQWSDLERLEDFSNIFASCEHVSWRSMRKSEDAKSIVLAMPEVRFSTDRVDQSYYLPAAFALGATLIVDMLQKLHAANANLGSMTIEPVFRVHSQSVASQLADNGLSLSYADEVSPNGSYRVTCAWSCPDSLSHTLLLNRLQQELCLKLNDYFQAKFSTEQITDMLPEIMPSELIKSLMGQAGEVEGATYRILGTISEQPGFYCCSKSLELHIDMMDGAGRLIRSMSIPTMRFSAC